MHIHGNHMQLQAANLPSAAALEKAAAAQRAAEVRARLLNSTGEVEGELNPEARFLVGRWPEGNSRQQQDQNQEQDGTDASASPGTDDMDSKDKPVSVWA